MAINPILYLAFGLDYQQLSTYQEQLTFTLLIIHFSTTLLAVYDIPFNNICNSSASCCAFNSLNFFPNGMDDTSPDLYLGGIANSLAVNGIGTATITLQTHSSALLCISIPHSLNVPELPCNLLSPQWLIFA